MDIEFVPLGTRIIVMCSYSHELELSYDGPIILLSLVNISRSSHLPLN